MTELDEDFLGKNRKLKIRNCNLLDGCYEIFSATIRAAIESQESLGPLTTDALPTLIKHGVVCYLLIPFLMCPSAH